MKQNKTNRIIVIIYIHLCYHHHRWKERFQFFICYEILISDIIDIITGRVRIIISPDRMIRTCCEYNALQLYGNNMDGKYMIKNKLNRNGIIN